MIKILDTPDEIHKKQLEIIHSKTARERALMGMDMIDSTYQMITNVIRQKYPNIPQGQLVAKVFMRYYKNDFQEDELNHIAQKIREAHNGLNLRG